jgi:hypothetical protein
MHDRYLYRARRGVYSASAEGTEDTEEKNGNTERAVPGGETDATGNLPLDI